MKYDVTISERAEKNLDKIFVYLNDNWPEKVKNDFKNKLKNEINHLRENPFIYQASSLKKNIRRCVITKHNVMYFRIEGTEVEIITIQ